MKSLQPFIDHYEMRINRETTSYSPSSSHSWSRRRMPWVEGGLAGLFLFCILQFSAEWHGMFQCTLLQATMTTQRVPMSYGVPPPEFSSTSSSSDTGNGITDPIASSTSSSPPPSPCPIEIAPIPPPPLRLCSVPRITAGDGTQNVALYNNKVHTALLTFQCGGDEYHQFGRRILDLHQKLASQGTQSGVSPLGRRDSPLPGQDKSILFIGNSHTRQQVETLLCQYSEVLESGFFEAEETATEGKVYLKNNHTIQWVTNNFAFYGHDWQHRLETLIDKPLASLDAIIVGRFNQLDESWNTTFYKQMMAFGATDKSIDFEHIKPPNLEQVAAVYSGFLIGAGPYAVYGIPESQVMERKAQELGREGRAVAYIDGRKFISEVGEGAAGSRLGLNFCVNSDKGQNLHRCTGPYGGIVDVTIWELVELFYRYLV